MTVSVMSAPSCAWTVAALGPVESPRVDLVTRDFDVPVVENLRQDLEPVDAQELGVCRDPWTIAGC